MELNLSIGMDVSEYEFRSSYSCSRIACIACGLGGAERNADSSFNASIQHNNHGDIIVVTDFTGCQHPTDFPDNRFIAAKVGRPFKHEAKIVAKVVPFVFAPQLHREANDPVFTRSAFDKPAA